MKYYIQYAFMTKGTIPTASVLINSPLHSSRLECAAILQRDGFKELENAQGEKTWYELRDIKAYIRPKLYSIPDELFYSQYGCEVTINV